MIKEFKNQYFFLSNFYECPIYYNKLVFCNAEAAFQAQKAIDEKEQYKFIRDSQYAQYQSLNLGMGYIMTSYLANNRDIKSEEFKESKKNLKNSNPIFKDIECGKGIDTLSLVTQKVKKDFLASLKNGLAKGERSCVNYKRTFPLMTRGRDLKFYYDDKDILIKWVNNIIFKVE